jgi:hypothetical protein
MRIKKQKIYSFVDRGSIKLDHQLAWLPFGGIQMKRYIERFYSIDFLNDDLDNEFKKNS